MGPPKTISAKKVSQNLMIVCIPNVDQSNTDFGLVDVTGKNMKDFRRSMNEQCENLLPLAPQKKSRLISRGMQSNSMSRSLNLEVHQVGNYKISIAPTLEDFETRVNWDEFDLPEDFKSRKSTLSDATLFPFKVAYVIAQAQTAVKDDGFAVIYPATEFAYFPTCHEISPLSKIKAYDVRCYAWEGKARDHFGFKSDVPFTSFQGGKVLSSKPGSSASPVESVGVETKSHAAKAFNLPVTESIRAHVNKLPNTCIMAANGDKADFKYDMDNIEVVNYCPLKCRAPNQNIVM